MPFFDDDPAPPSDLDAEFEYVAASSAPSAVAYRPAYTHLPVFDLGYKVNLRPGLVKNILKKLNILPSPDAVKVGPCDGLDLYPIETCHTVRQAYSERYPQILREHFFGGWHAMMKWLGFGIYHWWNGQRRAWPSFDPVDNAAMQYVCRSCDLWPIEPRTILSYGSPEYYGQKKIWIGYRFEIAQQVIASHRVKNPWWPRTEFSFDDLVRIFPDRFESQIKRAILRRHATALERKDKDGNRTTHYSLGDVLKIKEYFQGCEDAQKAQTALWPLARTAD
jgi:hypothetical protein